MTLRLLPTPLRRLLALWQLEFKVYRASDADAATIRARHLQAVAGMTPLMMAANGVAGLMLVAALQGHVPMWQTGLWLGVLYAVCGSALLGWWRRRQRSVPTSASPAAIDSTVRGALVLSLVWAVAVAAWFGDIPPDRKMLVSTLVVGWMCAGAFALTPVPQAALTFLWVLTLGSQVALARSGGLVYVYLQGMVLLYGVVLGLCVLVTARSHTARLVSEREAERQRQLVGLLLHDFEQHAADVLWEVGPEGRLSHASHRLAALLSCSVEQLRDQRLDTLLAQSVSPGGQAHVDDLQHALAASLPFRDLLVPVNTAQGARWWAVTAKPLLDADGHSAGWRGVIADVTAARQAHLQLHQLVHFDPLTGLANRRQMSEGLGRSLKRYPDRRLALICLDVDYFKAINNTLGHGVGDAVLQELAGRLRASLRQADQAVRLGGDEFALVLHDLGADHDPYRAAEELMQQLSRPCEVAGHRLNLSLGMGLALAPQHGRSVDELLAHADLALQAAKQAGRGRWEIYLPRMGEQAQRRVQIGQALHGALDRGEMQLHWQPQVDIARWQPIGAEVLLRWQHAQLGALRPRDFIAAAEESGQMAHIGAWVLEQACLGALQLPQHLTVAVNLAPSQLLSEDLLAIVSRALLRTRLPAQRLELEITEALLVAPPPVVMANLHGLQDLGVRVSLDDFGAGHSSLLHLRQFSFHRLKIDQALVSQVGERADARAVLTTLVSLARELDIHSLAEGVEDDAQLAALRQAGCEALQGFLVDWPMPLPQLVQRLANWQVERIPKDALARRVG